jgi:hypothetical protein
VQTRFIALCSERLLILSSALRPVPSFSSSLFCHKSHQPTAPCWFFINDQRGCTNRRCAYPLVLYLSLRLVFAAGSFRLVDLLRNLSSQPYWARDLSAGFDSRFLFRFAHSLPYLRNQHCPCLGYQLSTSSSSPIRRAFFVQSEASSRSKCRRPVRPTHRSPLGHRRAGSSPVDEPGSL